MGGVLKVKCFSLLFCLGGVCPVFCAAFFIFFVSVFDTPPGEPIRFTLKGMPLPSGMRRESYFRPNDAEYLSMIIYAFLPNKDSDERNATTTYNSARAWLRF